MVTPISHREVDMGIKITSLLVTGIALPWFGLADVASTAEPYGLWVRPSTGTQAGFYDCGGKLCSKIVSVKEEARKKEVRTAIMHGAAKTGDNKWAACAKSTISRGMSARLKNLENLAPATFNSITRL
jgi:hypothetical protein